MSELPQIKGVNRVKKTLRDGSEKFFFYHRATRTRLPDDPESPDFKRTLARLEREDAPPPDPVETVSWLVQKYQQASDWTGLAPYTREVEQYRINKIEEDFGGLLLTGLEERGARAMLLEWRDEIAVDHPRAADAALSRFARIIRFGFDREYIGRHPIASFKRVYKVDRSEVIWLPEHFAKLATVASPEIKLAAFTAMHTGQRRGDLLNMRWHNYDGQRINLIQSKTGARVDFPATLALKRTLDALRAERQPKAGDYILLNHHGKPWTNSAWMSGWRRSVDDAELPDIRIERESGRFEMFSLHFHDIRGTAVTMLAESGCTIPQICAITGHSLVHAGKILEKYMSMTRSLADEAIAKVEMRLIQAL